jgi:hypothetical protein
MPFVATASAGGWQNELDRQRILSYGLYDDMYKNDPAQYKLMLRGTEEKPVLVPTASNIIKALSRYVGKDWGFRVLGAEVAEPGAEGEAEPADPEAEVATPEQVMAAQIQYGKLFARERLLTKFRASTPEWLRRGDECWFISANPMKKSGSRISIRPIDPRRYFPLNGDLTDPDRVTGQRLIEEVLLADGKTVALFVQEWLKSSDPGHPDWTDPASMTPEPEEGYDITYSAQAYDVKDFNDPAKRKSLAYALNVPLDYVYGIKQLPIYHIKNNEETDQPFGKSELAGLESILAGINQTVTDEDLALSFLGLGMYWTDSGAPVDESTGQPTNWRLGPKRVIEVDEGTQFGKVDGIDSVQPFQEHVGYLENQAQGNVGLSDVSVGTADSVSDMSGIALAIRFSPTIDAVAAKNEARNGVWTQLLYDLKDWFLAFEQVDLGPVEVISVTEDKGLLPFDREGRWKELMEGVTNKVFTPEYAVSVLEQEFGYEFPAGYVAQLTSANAAAAAALDPLGARVGAENAIADTEAAEEPAEEPAA